MIRDKYNLGGLAEERPDEHFDAEQLKRGIEVEMENTDDPEKAKELAKDNLEEFPDYYARQEGVDENTVQQEPTPAPSLEHQDTAYEADWEEDERLEDEDHQIIEKEDKDLEVAMENLRQLEAISEEMDADGAVSRRLAVAMESAYPGILPEDYPLESFTVGASRTNLNVAMERINITKDQMKAGLIGAAVALLAKILHWIYKKFKGMGGSLDKSTPAADESLKVAKKADDVSKEMKRVRDKTPLGGDSDDTAGSGQGPRNVLELLKEDRLTKSDFKGFTVAEVGKLLDQRRRAVLYEKLLDPIYHGLEEAILSEPKEWATAMKNIIGVLRERVNDHSSQMSIYKAAADQFKYEGEGEKSKDHKKLTTNKGNLLPKDFHYTPSPKGKNTPEKIYSLSTGGQRGSADDAENLVSAAIDALTGQGGAGEKMTEKRDASKVKSANVDDLIHVLMSINTDPKDFLENVKHIQDEVANWGGDAPPQVAGPDAVDAMKEFQVKFKADMRLTQRMAQWYLQILRAMNRIVTKVTQANGQYAKEVSEAVAAISVWEKAKDTLSFDNDLKSLKAAADELSEGTQGLSGAIAKMKEAMEKDREAAAKE